MFVEGADRERAQEVQELFVVTFLLANLFEVYVEDVLVDIGQHVLDQTVDCAHHFFVLAVLARPRQVNIATVKRPIIRVCKETKQHVRAFNNLDVGSFTEDDLKNLVLLQPLCHQRVRQVARSRQHIALKLIVEQHFLEQGLRILAILNVLLEVHCLLHTVNHESNVLEAADSLFQVL